MNLGTRVKATKTVADLFETYFSDGNYAASQDLDFLVELVHFFRPHQPKEQRVSLEILLVFLAENPIEKGLFIRYVQHIFANRKFSRMLSDAGILKDSDFIYEVKQRLIAKILPFQPEKDTMEYVLNQVFYLDTDTIWVNHISKEELRRFFQLLELSDLFSSADEGTPISEVLNGMTLLTQRMSGRAMENDVIKMVPEYDAFDSPFVAMEKEFLKVEQVVRQDTFILADNLHYKQFAILHKQCEEYVEKAFGNSSKYGISLKVNQSLLRIQQQLYRLKVLLPLLVVNSESDKIENTIQLALKLIKYNCFKNNVSKLINDSTQLLSYEITQHTAKTGEHYITETAKEYFQMLRAAMGAGLVVGFLCVFKVLLSKVETSYFGYALLYSMNYAFGFIAIFLLGFALATKQPAMTAATIAKALENGMKQSNNNQEKHSSFAHLFARLFRSQFIAFVGNVSVAFPVALVGIWLIDAAFQYNIAETKWQKLITDISPVASPAIFHAAIAGVFLFLSGIISGSVSNRNKHQQVYYRIEEHPFLKMTFGVAKTKCFANWIENNWAGVISNFWFGVFMGSTASVGAFFGLDLDIRHITFASGNLALGLYGADFHITQSMLFWGILGIGVIGFVNFMVSFSLSLGLALRSRNIPLPEIRLLYKAILTYFKKQPSAFFFPVKEK